MHYTSYLHGAHRSFNLHYEVPRDISLRNILGNLRFTTLLQHVFLQIKNVNGNINCIKSTQFSKAYGK